MSTVRNVYIFSVIFFLFFLSGCIKSKIFDSDISEYAKYEVKIKYSKGKVPQYEKREIVVDLDGKKTELPDNSKDKIIIRAEAENITLSVKYLNNGKVSASGQIRFNRYDRNRSGKLVISEGNLSD